MAHVMQSMTHAQPPLVVQSYQNVYYFPNDASIICICRAGRVRCSQGRATETHAGTTGFTEDKDRGSPREEEDTKQRSLSSH